MKDTTTAGYCDYNRRQMKQETIDQKMENKEWESKRKESTIDLFDNIYYTPSTRTFQLFPMEYVNRWE